MKLKILNNGAKLVKGTNNSAGYDVVASEDITLKPWQSSMVSTNLFIEIEEGYEGQLRSRSSLSTKHRLILLNGIGTIDSDYRGEVKVPLLNLGNEEYQINKGDRIAQLVFNKLVDVEQLDVERLEESERGKGGFGSTGR